MCWGDSTSPTPSYSISDENPGLGTLSVISKAMLGALYLFICIFPGKISGQGWDGQGSTGHWLLNTSWPDFTGVSESVREGVL